MRESRASAFVLGMLFGALPVLVAGTAEAAMVTFEAPTYTAANGFIGVDGWVDYLGADSLVTPDPIWTGETRVLEGLQSGRLGGVRSIALRKFDEGPTEYGTGTVVSGRMLVDGLGGSGEFYFSHDVAALLTPAGIVGNIGGNFDLFGRNEAGVVGNIDTGIPFAINADYLLEIALDFEAKSFTAYATNRTAGTARTTLGTALLGGKVPTSSYTTAGFALITRNVTAIYDELDIHVVPPEPGPQLLPGTVDFEAPVYVAGKTVLNVDGWTDFLGAKAVVTPDPTGSGDTRVLKGTKSLRLGGDNRSIVYRNFGPGTTYDDGTVISGRMLVDGPANGHGEFFFSHNLSGGSGLATPGGIIGIIGGDFYLFGLQNGQVVSPNGIDTGVPFLTNVDYLLEVQLDLTNQTFESFVTNLTAGEPRLSLGTAEFWVAPNYDIPPGDDSNSGFVLVTRANAVGIFDELRVSTGTAPPHAGDANGDGKVDDLDASILAANWQRTGGATWAQADFNADGNVNDLDASILAANWQYGVGAAVPEPSVPAALVGLSLAALTVRRRRRAAR